MTSTTNISNQITNQFIIPYVRYEYPKEVPKDLSTLNPFETFYENGSIKSRHYIHVDTEHEFDDEYNSEDEYDENGDSIEPLATYYTHRDEKEGPAYEEYYENGNIKIRKYIEYDRWHRTNSLPAIECYYPSGNIAYKAYYKHGTPNYKAENQQERFSEDGELIYSAYYILRWKCKYYNRAYYKKHRNIINPLNQYSSIFLNIFKKTNSVKPI
jgi:hypothetical protein